MPTLALTAKQQTWLEHVRAADTSGGSILAYAAENGLTAKALYAWKTRLIRLGAYSPEKISDFTPVEAANLPPPAVVSEQPRCRVVLPTGTQIEFLGELSATTIQSILTLCGSTR